jgi:heat shock protein beta
VALPLHAQAEEVASDVPPTVDADLKAEKVPLKTDDDVAQREERSIAPSEGYTDDELKLIEQSAEKFEFQAEVPKIMNIIVRSLYSNKNIFLRELISNASDALDKIRLISLTNPSALDTNKNLEIKIKADLEANTLTITDTGIGMTRDELIRNLGTIAQSGTKEFAEALSSEATSNLIGQFGVGFYSAFLVADKITVTSKHNDDPKQWIWESSVGSSFTISEDPRGVTLGRGTRITLHIRDESESKVYLHAERIRELVDQYSGFIAYPIYLWDSHEVEKEVPADEEEEAEEADLEETEDEEEEEAEEDEPKTKTVKEKVWEWKRLNDKQPVWLRNKNENTEQDYINFYKALTKDTGDPLTYVHFTAEGDTQFKSILYLPEEPPYGQFDTLNRHRGVKLYVRRVFITDNFDSLIPRYLGFLRGVVDSDTLPLNVSREILQEDKALENIKKKLVRKAIAMFQMLADESKHKHDDESEDQPESDTAADAAATTDADADSPKYVKFWKAYGTNVKLGVIEDSQNRTRLSKLLRFISSKTEKLTSLDAYVERMKEGQDQIYYLAGESIEAVRASPLVEAVLHKGYEVLYMLDPIDEYVMQHLTKYDSKYRLVNLGKEGVHLDKDSDEKKDSLKEAETELKPLIEFLEEQLSDKISEVKVSDRLLSSPCALVASTHGYTASMERVVKSQALADSRSRELQWMGKKIMEINPSHPIITHLAQILRDDPADPRAADIASLLLESSAIASGYSVQHPDLFAGRINRLLSASLGLPPDNSRSQDATHTPTHHDEL